MLFGAKSVQRSLSNDQTIGSSTDAAQTYTSQLDDLSIEAYNAETEMVRDTDDAITERRVGVMLRTTGFIKGVCLVQ